jgi:hypothetical protein
LSLFAIGQKEVSMIQVKDFGVDLLSNFKIIKKYSIQEIQAIAIYSSKLAKYLGNSTFVFYLLALTNQDSF